MKMYILLFIFFSLLYTVFEVGFNAIIFPQINKMLNKKRWSLFGFTSIWMVPFGGICAVIINLFYQIPIIHDKVMVFPIVMIFGMIVITALEFWGGYLLNIKLKLNIWNYDTKIKLFGKEIPLNYKGQICLYHSIGWFFITYPICKFSDILLFLCK